MPSSCLGNDQNHEKLEPLERNRCVQTFFLVAEGIILLIFGFCTEMSTGTRNDGLE
jgi:hypothetical protein